MSANLCGWVNSRNTYQLTGKSTTAWTMSGGRSNTHQDAQVLGFAMFYYRYPVPHKGIVESASICRPIASNTHPAVKFECGLTAIAKIMNFPEP